MNFQTLLDFFLYFRSQFLPPYNRQQTSITNILNQMKKICGKQVPKITNIYFAKLPVIMQSKFYAKSGAT